MSSSKPAGCTFELTATERFSYAASTKRKNPSAASGLTGSSPISSTTISRALRMACTALVTESSARCRRMGIRMDDGTEGEVGPGDVFFAQPGHDAWTVGDEPC